MEHCGYTVTKVEESDPWEVACVYHTLKVVGHKVRIDWRTICLDTNITRIMIAVPHEKLDHNSAVRNKAPAETERGADREQHETSAGQLEGHEKHLRQEERGAGTIEKYLRDIKRFTAWLGRSTVTRESVTSWK